MIYLVNIIKKNIDLITISFLFIFSPMFFYKLGQSSLFSWDEGWYAEIARNILKTGDIFVLYFNGSYYYDHPPVGFWLIALSMRLFGESEFWIRFPSAILGLGCLILTYLIGKSLFSRIVGVTSAVSLVSTIWFVNRSRSGNLDVFLTFFFLLTFYLALKARYKNSFILPFFISLTLLFLTKTLVPLTIIPALILIFWGSKTYLNRWFFVGIGFFILIFGGWFLRQIDIYDGFKNHYLGIGLPGVKTEANYLDNLYKIKGYLHNGIGKWFWPSILGIFGGVFFLKRSFLILLVFFVSFFTPFIFSHRGQIWHLIPLYPFMLIALYGFMFSFLNFVFSFVPSLIPPRVFRPNNKPSRFKLKMVRHLFLALPLFLIMIYFLNLQIKPIWYQVIDIPAFKSDEQILSIEASKYPQRLYITGDFIPTAVFYSKKEVKTAHEYMLEDLFKKEDQFLIILPKEKLDSLKLSGRGINIKELKSDRGNVLVLKQ